MFNNNLTIIININFFLTLLKNVRDIIKCFIVKIYHKLILVLIVIIHLSIIKRNITIIKLKQEYKKVEECH